jgi:hypothetical protein
MIVLQFFVASPDEEAEDAPSKKKARRPLARDTRIEKKCLRVMFLPPLPDPMPGRHRNHPQAKKV